MAALCQTLFYPVVIHARRLVDRVGAAFEQLQSEGRANVRTLRQWGPVMFPGWLEQNEYRYGWVYRESIAEKWWWEGDL